MGERHLFNISIQTGNMFLFLNILNPKTLNPNLIITWPNGIWHLISVLDFSPHSKQTVRWTNRNSASVCHGSQQLSFPNRTSKRDDFHCSGYHHCLLAAWPCSGLNPWFMERKGQCLLALASYSPLTQPLPSLAYWLAFYPSCSALALAPRPPQQNIPNRQD